MHNYLKNLQPFTRKGRGFCFTLCTLSYLIPILQWRPIWGWILRADSPLFRTSFSKAFQCSCAFFEYAFQIIMQVVSLSMLALQTVCCHNFSFYFFIVRNALLEWALTCNTKNLCNDCCRESTCSLTNLLQKEFKKAGHLFKE